MAKKPKALKDVPQREAPPTAGQFIGGIKYSQGNRPADVNAKRVVVSGGMSDEDVQSAIKLLTMAAERYIEDELSPDRSLMLKAYRAGPQGNEEEGRSQVVMSTVRDNVLAMEPQLLRAIFGPEPAIEFRPSRPELVEQCQQQSDYVSYLYRSSPDALLNAKAFIADGLITRTGFVTWWWERYTQPLTYMQEGLTREQVAMYENDPTVTYTITQETQREDGTVTYDCSVTKTQPGTCQWAAVPPEEVIWSRDARSWKTATLVARRQDKSVGDLVKDGFDYDEVLKYAKAVDRILWAQENLERQPNEGTTVYHDGDQSPDPSLWRVAYYRIYARLDEDNDHIAELREYHAVGPYQLIKRTDDTSKFWGTPIPRIPLAGWCPYPIAHTPTGQSVSDLSMDLQRIDTALMRGTLDSLGLALNGRIAVDEEKARIGDVLNTEIGALLRGRGDPANWIKEFTHQFVGEKALPVMAFMRDVNERRTGDNMESQGLNADALQSSTKQGVMATLSAAAARSELMARMLGEGLRELFLGLRDLTKLHQDYPRIVRMNGQWVTVDPRLWDDECEAHVVLGLGMGLAQEKLDRLMAIKAQQEAILQMLGPANPIVGLDQYTNTLQEIVKAAGNADAEKYFKVVPKVQADQLAQQAAQQPKQEDPSSQASLMQAQAQMLQAQTAAKRLELDQSKQSFEQELAIEKLRFDQMLAEETLRQEMALKSAEIEARYATKLKEAQLDAYVRGQGHAQDFVVDSATAERQAQAQLDSAAIDAKAKVEVARTHAHAKVIGEVVKGAMKGPDTVPDPQA